MFLFAGSIIMLGWALISMLFGFQPTFLFGACGAALMSGYIIYDTHKVPIPPLPPSPFLLLLRCVQWLRTGSDAPVRTGAS